MLHSDELVAHLMENGLIQAQAVVDGQVRVVEASRRNRNFHVLPDAGTRFVVKQGLGAGTGPGTVLYEASVHDALAHIRDAESLAGAIPRSFGFDATLAALVLEHVGVENVREYHYRLGSAPPTVAESMGETLGALHEAGSRELAAGKLDGLAKGLPETVDLLLPKISMLHETSFGTQALIAALQGTADLAGPFAQVFADWRCTSLIHGDPRWDNWVIARHEPRERLVLVDWEFARAGDPAWDMGCLLGDYVAAWVVGTPEVPGSTLSRSAQLSSFPLDELQPAMRALWLAYLRRRRPDDPAEELVLAVRFSAAKLIQLSAERMYRAAQLDAVSGALMQLAANIFADPERAADQLLGIRTTERETAVS